MSPKPEKNVLTGNKGEWSEVYAFLKVLADGELCGCTEDLEKDASNKLEVLKAIHGALMGKSPTEASQTVKIWYSTTPDNPDAEPADFREFSKEALAKMTTDFFGRIYAHRASKGSFSDPEIDDFLRSVGCRKMKAKSADKADMDLVVRDPYVGGKRRYGFSVKSQIGRPATLLNASKATNAKFLVEGLSDEEAERINAIGKKDDKEGNKKKRVDVRLERVKAILAAGATLTFDRWNNRTFAQNLAQLDEGLPKIVAQMLLAVWLYQKKQVSEACQWVEERDPQRYGEIYGSTALYASKICRLLRSSALGMKPTVLWTDKDDATGGYLIVLGNGDLVAFYIYNRAAFDRYLFNSTYIEIPSLTRHDAMCLYKEDGKWYVNLCLDIRFRK